MKYYCDIYKLEYDNLSSLLKRAGINPLTFNKLMISKNMNGDFSSSFDSWRYMKNYLNDIFRQKKIGVRVI